MRIALVVETARLAGLVRPDRRAVERLHGPTLERRCGSHLTSRAAIHNLHQFPGETQQIRKLDEEHLDCFVGNRSARRLRERSLPKHIKGWGDLVKPGIQVITPNPLTSGGARWNVMAAYGAQRRGGKSDKQGVKYLYKLFHHVPVQPASAREALTIFAQGKGDVLLTYENEAIFANKKGVHTDYHVPKATLLIETPAALTKTGLKKPAAKAFYKYLWSSTAQKAFAAQGYRPVVRAAARGTHFYSPPGLFTISTAKLGLNGWTKVNQRFFDP